MRKVVFAWLLGIGLLGLGPGLATACPTCSGAVAKSPEGGARLSSAYNASILLMIAVPFTLLGAGGLMVARAIRRGDFAA